MRHLLRLITFFFCLTAIHLKTNAQQVTFQQAWDAAQQGNVAGYRILGYMYLTGDGTSKNTNEALKWLNKAADAGDASGNSLLGWMYMSGTGVEQNYNLAFKYYKVAADKSATDAYWPLGWLYWTGNGTVQNLPKAYKWTKLAVDNGQTQAYVPLARMYLGGIGTTKNDLEGFRLLKLASDNGDINSYGVLGYCYQNGIGTTQNLEEGFKWYKLGAENGDVDSYLSLAYCYYNGAGVLKNESEGLKWAKEAADKGNMQAFLFIGLSYMNGDGVVKDSIEGLNWIKKAAEKSYIPAFAQLGSLYIYGRGVKKDYNEAIKWLRKGADAGDGHAYLSLGIMYNQGYGFKQNYEEANKYYKLAADKGIAMGYNNLAYNYACGYGGKVDLKEGLKLVNKALEIEKFPEALDTKGEIYYLLGDIENARECYKEILSDFPDYYVNYKKNDLDNEDSTPLQRYLTQSDIDTNIPKTNIKDDKTFVVVVANEMYKREDRVPFAANDGNTFAKYCKLLLGIPESNVHVVINATLNDIKHEVSWLTKVLNAYGGEGKGIFYYAGHGIPDDATKNAYLLPVDGYGNDINTGYSLNQLYKDLGSTQSQGITVFLDACFSGAKREGGMMTSNRGIALKANEGVPEGNVVVFSASYGDETASSYSKMGHGLFTYYLLKELKDTKGDVTLKQLGDYVTKEVGRQSLIINNKPQTPTVISSKEVEDSWENWKLK